MRDKIAALEAEWHIFLCGMMQRAMEVGQLRADLDVEQFVWELGGIYLARRTSQRFLRSPESDGAR